MIADGVILLRTDGIRCRHRQNGIIRELASGINQREVLLFDVVPFINGTDEIAPNAPYSGLGLFILPQFFMLEYWQGIY